MPFSISWIDRERTILFISAEGEWSIEEFLKFLSLVVLYLHQVSHPVYVIADVRQSAAPPLGIIWYARYIFQRMPGNFAGSIVVTNNEFWRNVIATIRALYIGSKRLHYVHVRTIEEAHELIRQWKAEGN